MRNKYKLRSDGRREATKTYNGKKKHFYGKTDAEIDAKIAEYEENLSKQSSIPFGEVADEYWERKRKDLSINTYGSYECPIRRAKEKFGETPINEITPLDIYTWLETFKAKDYSSKLISNTKSVLKGIFDLAFIKGLIASNPCVGIPQLKGKKKEPRQPASDKDIKLLTEFRDESLIAKLHYFLLMTGARIGEASALQMKDIDLEKRVAYVHQTLVYGNQSDATIKPTPKTDASIRTLALPLELIDHIPKYNDPNKFIFFPDGFPRRRAYEKALSNFRESHGIESTPHQFRHSYASMLHSAGIDVKDAQSLLGHSSIVMTQDIYTHLESEHRDNVLKSIDDYMNNRKSSK